jgi:hypothetical protein
MTRNQVLVIGLSGLVGLVLWSAMIVMIMLTISSATQGRRERVQPIPIVKDVQPIPIVKDVQPPPAVKGVLGATDRLDDASLVGTWVSHSPETLDFFADGTFTQYHPDLQGRYTHWTGTYKVIAKDRVKIQLGGVMRGTEPFIAKASIRGRELTWTTGYGTVRFRRAD